MKEIKASLTLNLIEAPNQKEDFCNGCIFNGYRHCALNIQERLQCFENEKHYIWIKDTT